MTFNLNLISFITCLFKKYDGETEIKILFSPSEIIWIYAEKEETFFVSYALSENVCFKVYDSVWFLNFEFLNVCVRNHFYAVKSVNVDGN